MDVPWLYACTFVPNLSTYMTGNCLKVSVNKPPAQWRNKKEMEPTRGTVSYSFNLRIIMKYTQIKNLILLVLV